MVLPDAFAVRVPCTKCKKAKKGLLRVCRVCGDDVCSMQYAGFKYCRVMMKHGRTEVVQEEPKVSQSPIKKEAKVWNWIGLSFDALMP